jgi:hypothetical protein
VGCRKCSRIKWATSSPRSFPVVRSVRKWTPAKIRLRIASCSAAEKLLKERPTPRQNLGGYVEIELVLLKERSEQEGGASADHRVRSGVRRIGRGFASSPWNGPSRSQPGTKTYATKGTSWLRVTSPFRRGRAWASMSMKKRCATSAGRVSSSPIYDVLGFAGRRREGVHVKGGRQGEPCTLPIMTEGI